MRVLHFSDVHLGLSLRGIPPAEWTLKRVAGAANLLRGRGNHFVDVPERVAKLAELAAVEGVDIVVFTGDFTALGTEAEFAAARDAFAPFTGGSFEFIGLPGNHDLYTASVLEERRFERHFGTGTISDPGELELPGLASDGPWPLVRLFGDDLAIVAVNSARPNRAPWKSSGRIPPTQIGTLHRILDEPEIARRVVFVATHYAPRMPDGRPDTRQHGLENAGELLTECRAITAGGILCGHVHHTYRIRMPGEPEIFCAGSATFAGREGFWLFDIDGGHVAARRGRWTAGGYATETV